jgi:hypothetical protein
MQEYLSNHRLHLCETLQLISSIFIQASSYLYSFLDGDWYHEHLE